MTTVVARRAKMRRGFNTSTLLQIQDYAASEWRQRPSGDGAGVLWLTGGRDGAAAVGAGRTGWRAGGGGGDDCAGPDSLTNCLITVRLAAGTNTCPPASDAVTKGFMK